MEVSGVGVVAFLLFLLAPGASTLLKSIAFRIRASGKAELLRAERESGGHELGARRTDKRGKRG